MNTGHLLLTCGAALCLPSCTTHRTVPFRTSPEGAPNGGMARHDYSTYEKVPSPPTSTVYRVCLKAIPYTRKRAFWGNWAGSGCRGGQPIDAMDEIFRLHDIAYLEAKSIRTLRTADRACVEALKQLNESSMSPDAIDFRKRAVSFFSNPALALIGKPLTCFVRRSEAQDCPLQSEADVWKLFGFDERHPPAATRLTERVILASRERRPAPVPSPAPDHSPNLSRNPVGSTGLIVLAASRSGG